MANKKFDLLSLNEQQIREITMTMDCKSLPTEVVEYMSLMEKARDWHYQMKSRVYCLRQLKAHYFVRFGETLADYSARQIYENALNYFYTDRNIRKESWRNILAEKYMLAAQICFEKNDLEGYRKFLNSVERIKRLNEKDDEGIDPKLLDRRVFVYFVSGKEIGIPEVDRTELGRMIDSYDINESLKVKVKREAGTLPRKLFDGEGDIIDLEEIK
jgi:CRISPR/Cas system CSM-associated protein Csm2 small subunit